MLHSRPPTISVSSGPWTFCALQLLSLGWSMFCLHWNRYRRHSRETRSQVDVQGPGTEQFSCQVLHLLCLDVYTAVIMLWKSPCTLWILYCCHVGVKILFLSYLCDLLLKWSSPLFLLRTLQGSWLLGAAGLGFSHSQLCALSGTGQTLSQHLWHFVLGDDTELSPVTIAHTLPRW